MSKIEAYAEIRPLFCNSNDEMPSPESVNNEPISYMSKKSQKERKTKRKREKK